MRKIFFTLSVVVLFSCKKEGINEKILFPIENKFDNLKINQMQFVGSHNSYRIKTNPKILNFLFSIQVVLPSDLAPESLDYEHLTLTEQLNDYGIRNLEIDIYNDPIGGQFSKRKLNALVGESVNANIPSLFDPGFKVLHIPDVDYNTHNFTFKSAIQEIKNWSDANQDHLPIFIYIEPKETSVENYLPFLPFSKVIPYTLEAMDEFDAEIKAVFGENLENVFSPDEMIGDFATLEEAALANIWPSLKETRGKIFFIIGGSDDFNQKYTTNHPNLSNRVCFLFSEPGVAEAAFLLMNDAKEDELKIQNLVKKGYMVRTFTDNTYEAKNNDYTKSIAALNSGAQILTTDYYRPDVRWSTYKFRLPNGATAQINPFTGNVVDKRKYIWDIGFPLSK